MAVVFIPAILRPLAGGQSKVLATGATLRDVVQDLERQYPGLAGRIIDAGGIRPELFLAVRGSEETDLTAAVGEDDEVHVLPAIAGGAQERVAE